MSAEQQQLEPGIQALEAQRALLGDAVVDATIGGLRARLQHDASAGLAQAALVAGDPATAQAAMAALQALLDHIAAGGTPHGTEHPRWIELTCHQALARAGDARADEWLASAHTALMAQADAISQHSADPALRHGFLNNIPHHRAIVAAWARRAGAGAAAAGPAL